MIKEEDIKIGKMVWFAHFIGKLSIQKAIHLKICRIWEDGDIRLSNKDHSYFINRNKQDEMNLIFDNKQDCEKYLKKLHNQYELTHMN